MKKLFSAIVSAVVLFAACQKNEIAEPSRDGQVLYATIEDWSSTRTVLDEDNNIRWSEGDQIVGFLNSTLGLKYQVTASSVGQTSASFDEVSSGGLNAGTYLDHIIAYYPYSSAVKVAKSGADYTLEVVLPSEQTYAHESFGNGSFPMVAVSQTSNITFRNICGGMKLQLKGAARIASIKVEGKNGEKLSGKATVTAYTDNSKPSIAMDANASASAVLNCGAGILLNEDTATEFVISLPPTKFTKGFAITVTDTNGGTQIIETSKSNEVLRSSLLKMPVVTVEIAATPQEGDYVDEYGINHGQGIEIDGVVWAPVNCGYHATDFKYGKLYQWGRKYGQGYDGSIYDINGNTVEKLNKIIITQYDGVVAIDGNDANNANVFFAGVYEHNYDWAVSKEYKLWNIGTEENPVKTEYDPCPSGWRVPTEDELEGLLQNHSTWISEFGCPGYWFSGSVTYSESAHRLFLPAVGYRDYGSGFAYGYGINGMYWSSCPAYRYGRSLLISSDLIKVYNECYASGGAVRCVQDDTGLIPVESIKLNKTAMTLNIRDCEKLNATITPLQANHKSAFWMSDNIDVATVDSEGNVKAISEGTAIISAIAGMKIASCIVTVSKATDLNFNDYVDEYGINHGHGIEIDGVIWAPVNCGYHQDDFKYGKLYQWGRKYGQGYDGELYDDNYNIIGEYSDSKIPTTSVGPVSLYEGQSLDNANIYYDGRFMYNYDWLYPQNEALWNCGTEANPIKTEYDPCPTGWRVPTKEELKDLMNNYSSWSEQYDQPGLWLSGFNQYTETTNKVFFPAAGNLSYGKSYYRHQGGVYWSSRASDVYAEHLYITNKNIGLGGDPRSYGYSVRCVQYEGEYIPVMSIALDKTSLTLAVSGQQTISTTITPSNANHNTAFWYSDNSKVAVVDQNGNVTAIAEGTANITAMAGMQSVNCLVTVCAESEKTQYVDLSNSGTANCYIVSEVGTYKFTPTKGSSNESVGTIAFAETLWETFGTDVTPNVGDLVKNVKYESGVISFETPSTFKEGNAVIAAKDANGTILWSWHIWLTDQPEGQVYYNNAGTMMDRNLGATSATPGDVGALGLLYQWGRKDPFLGSSSISESVEAKSTITWPSSVQSDSNNGTMAYATQNPITFITRNIANLDWYYTGSFSTDNTRWTSSSDAKSIYDPCPLGWRIPADDEYGIWATAIGSYNTFHDYPYDSDNHGINFSGKYGSASTIWYPSTGYRNLERGNISNVGIRADVWLVYSFTNEMGAMSFDSDGNVAPLWSSYRAHGLSVRCLQE